MGRPEGEKPLITRDAGWVLFLGMALPAASLPVLVGAILVLEESPTSQVVGAVFIAVGVMAVIASTAMLIRKRPQG